MTKNLNYHHLRYFWTVASTGSIASAAAKLRVSAPAVSVQIQALEHSIGQPLFDRKGRSFVLTEAGVVALEYANVIFATGDELVSVLGGIESSARRPVRLGAVSTLSRNFQQQFIAPLLVRPDSSLLLCSGTLTDLMTELEERRLDVVLTNVIPARVSSFAWESHMLAEQPACLVAKPRSHGFAPSLASLMASERFVLPTASSGIRQAFDRLASAARRQPAIAAEVDDMAMLRLIAREHAGLTLVPAIVVRSELAARDLVVVRRLAGVVESFYAISAPRKLPNALLASLLERDLAAESERGGHPRSKASASKPRARRV